MTAQRPVQPNRHTKPVIDRHQQLLLRAVDLGLAAVIFIAPLVMGGRHPIGELVYVALVGLTAIAWTAKQSLSSVARWRRSGAELLLLGCLLLFVFQLVSLPVAFLHQVSPTLSETLPLWTTGEGAKLGTWSQISFVPAATRSLMVMFLAHAMLFLVVLQRIRERADVERLLRWLAIGAVAMACLGITQFLFGNGKFLWVYQHPWRTTDGAVKGPFINENHFAHFLALGVGPMLWWVRSAWQPANRTRKPNQRSNSKTAFVPSNPRRRAAQLDGQQMLLLGALGIVFLAALLTFSRGGVVVVLLAFASCCGIYAWKSLLNKRAIAALAGVGLVVVVALLIHGFTPLAAQMATLGGGSLDEMDRNETRRNLWAADVQAFADFSLLGTGGGSHANVYPMYYEEYSDREYVYAESGYIQILTEFGVLGVTLLVGTLGFVCWWCWRSLRLSKSAKLSACAGAVIAACAASLVHSIWDFVWYIPSCMSLTVMLAALSCRLCQLAKSERAASSNSPTNEYQSSELASSTGRLVNQSHKHAKRNHRTAWIAATAVTLLVSVAMIHNRVGPAIASLHWNRYLIMAAAARDGGYVASDESTNEEMLRHLKRAVNVDPHHGRARLSLAAIRLQRFDILQRVALNPMPLGQVRDAVGASGFTDAAALNEWLSAAIGENRVLLDLARRDAKLALAECPLQGEGYLYLAELSFLPGGRTTTEALVDQALRVRPHSGPVLAAAGNQAATSGDLQRALRLWKRAYHQDPKQRRRLVKGLAPNVSAEFFLSEFEPDLEGTGEIFQAFKDLQREDEAKTIAQTYAAMLTKAAKNGSDHATRNWRKASAVYKFLGDMNQSVACLKAAVESAPNDYAVHRKLAVELFRSARFEEAIAELEWCLARKHSDSTLRNLVAHARRGRLEQAYAPPKAHLESSKQKR